jgi:hypothetical protein
MEVIMPSSSRKWFKDVANLEELKKEYRQLAMQYHPDKGGSVEAMQSINEEYDRLLSYYANQSDNPSEEYQAGKDIMVVIEAISHLPNIEIEICGSWLWVSGNTYPVKNELKDAGLWWASKKKMWYWRPPEQKYKRHKTLEMPKIRMKYGSKKVKNLSYQLT